MKKAPTIRDVAAAAGVSVSVVSRVLNPDSGPVMGLPGFGFQGGLAACDVRQKGL